MSYTEIIKFDKNGKPHSGGRVQNASQGSYSIWNLLTNKYLTRDFNNIDPKKEQETWNLFRDSRLTDTEKIVLGSTFDYVLIKKDDINQVVDAYKKFCKEFSASERFPLSLDKQRVILEKLESDEDCIAVGFHQNSVSCDMWNDYNCLTGEKHWYLFE